MRVLLGVFIAVTSLVVGAVTACLTALNRARGAELDERQHTCETYWRRNELIRQDNASRQWRLLGEDVPEEELQEESRERLEH